MLAHKPIYLPLSMISVHLNPTVFSCSQKLLVFFELKMFVLLRITLNWIWDLAWHCKYKLIYTQPLTENKTIKVSLLLIFFRNNPSYNVRSYFLLHITWNDKYNGFQIFEFYLMMKINTEKRLEFILVCLVYCIQCHMTMSVWFYSNCKRLKVHEKK